MFAIDVVRKDTLSSWLNTPGNYYVGNPYAFGSIIADDFLACPFGLYDGKCLFIRSTSYFNNDYENLPLHHAYLLYISRHQKYLKNIINHLFDLWDMKIFRLGCDCVENRGHAFVLNELFVLSSRIEVQILGRLSKQIASTMQIINDKRVMKSEYLFGGCENEIWKFETDLTDGSEIKNTITHFLRVYAEERVATRLRSAGCVIPSNVYSDTTGEQRHEASFGA
tara:strand:+ start:92 stop:763 length:672 start_codon:yes stop_codon:yes gene_type:complete